MIHYVKLIGEMHHCRQGPVVHLADLPIVKTLFDRATIYEAISANVFVAKKSRSHALIFSEGLYNYMQLLVNYSI